MSGQNDLDKYSLKEDELAVAVVEAANKCKQPVHSVEDLIGSVGRWQINIALFYFFAYILSTFDNLGIAFHAAKTEYHCNDILNTSGASQVI